LQRKISGSLNALVVQPGYVFGAERRSHLNARELRISHSEAGSAYRLISNACFTINFQWFWLPSSQMVSASYILDSNAESHFSFTNALDFISLEQAHSLFAAVENFLRASWINAMHHHLQEYPMPVWW
jgi:hypothetical protein